ncbi:hypothetical protein Rhe02_55660 [Rhizocola hellebori]|uniref:Uncharacterized protein n=1 Tax=Rhizocola hellebori TaxID=1392758 RepID=A0A8J3QB20_9ACTN|nr:hypothetical protein [Rhizocola hellebori]GIH07499.1 hypothetical protein Rhe02_55660 [Rhizocola hellebori]
MGTYVATTPTRTGVVVTPGNVAATDVIPAALIGTKGCYLEIINGNASPDVMSISDASVTPSGAAAASNAPTVTNGTSKMFKILPQQVDPNAQNVTVTHSVTSTVTYKLYPLG